MEFIFKQFHWIFFSCLQTKKKMTKSTELSFGRKKTTKKEVGTPGDVKIMMCVRDFSGKKIGAPKWVRLPHMKNLEIDLVKQWYIRLQKARALKLVFIHGIQTCIRVCYGNKIPNWFKQKVVSSTSEKIIKDYFTKALRILMCMRLHEPNGAGFLLTNSSAAKATNFSQLQFKKFPTLSSSCRYFGQEPKTIFEIIDLIDQNITKPSNGSFQWDTKEYHTGKTWDYSIAGWQEKGTGEFKQRQILCKEVATAMKELFWMILRGAPVDVLLYGGYMSVNELIQQVRAHQATLENKQKTPSPGEGDLLGGTGATPPAPPAAGATPPAGEGGPPRYADATAAGEGGPPGYADAKATPPAAPPAYKAAAAPAWRSIGSKMAGYLDPRNYSSKSKARPVSGAPGEVSSAQANTQNLIGELDSFMTFGRSNGRGWSSGTAPMIGYVRPYRISGMESYTGMTPRMYRKHIDARTGLPTIGSMGPLSRANSYYGSYRLGEKLNPSFGRRTARKTMARKTTARKTTASKTTARKTTARKTTARKTMARKTTARKTTARKTTGKKKAQKSVSFGGRFFF